MANSVLSLGCWDNPTTRNLQEESIMRLLIDAINVQFRVAGVAKAKQDFKDKERQAVTRDGVPIWSVRLDAIDTVRETKETIWVEVAGNEPKLTFDGYAVVHGRSEEHTSELQSR